MPALHWDLFLDDVALGAQVARLRAGLAEAGWPEAEEARASARIVWADHPLPDAVVEALLRRGRPVVLAGPTLERADPHELLAAAAGVQVGPPTPPHDVRVRPGPDGAGLAVRLPDHAHQGNAHLGVHVHIHDRVLSLDKVGHDVEVLLTATVGPTVTPVATWRPASQVMAWTLGSSGDAVSSRSASRLLVLALRHCLGMGEPPAVRVGLLGYGAIGHEHSRAVRHVEGLHLAAVCDADPARVAAALAAAPSARGYPDAAHLMADADVDLVVVSTPPDTHAAWARAALEAGKHVVVEKPFAIRTEDADAVLALARERALTALVYQNRRFDPDHLAVKRAVDAGSVGEPFHVEAFVGGYGHPCNLWHSDAEVSGGAFYDWGAHVLDQLLDLLPGPVEHVTAVEHKRVWLDVTNADHSRVTLRLASGAEATFVYSDLAAALKPRWYVLGTRGAIVGHWRTERVVARSDIGTLAEDVLAPADSPPRLDLHGVDGAVTRLVTPPAQPYAFHRELADQLQLGLRASVTAEQSRRVLAVMEAASMSAASGGRPVQPR